MWNAGCWLHVPLRFLQKHFSFSTMRFSIMLSWALTFFVLALLAAILGFGGIAAGAASIGKVLFFLFLVLFVASLIMNMVRGRDVA